MVAGVFNLDKQCLGNKVIWLPCLQWRFVQVGADEGIACKCASKCIEAGFTPIGNIVESASFGAVEPFR
jgi:hypothetical protein